MFSVSPVFAYSTLWEFYTQNHMALPSLEQRKDIAEANGISDYRGTAEQNHVLLTVLAGNMVNQDQKLGAFNTSGGGTYRLKNSVGIADTSLPLSSFKEPVSNIPYTMSYLNTTIGYGTIDPQTSRSEFISFSGITQNSDGSAALTGVSRGLTRTPAGSSCTASTTLAQRHPGQSVFILSDSPCLFQEYAVKRNDETITGVWGFPYPSASNTPATKGYVDTLSFGSVATSTESTVGFVELSTQLEQASSTRLSGSTGAPLVLQAQYATSTFNSATAALKVVVTDNNGKIDTNFIATSTILGNLASTTLTLYIATTTAHDGNYTWTKPSGLKQIILECIGGGSSGSGGTVTDDAGGGGGGGGYVKRVIPASVLGATEAVTVGRGRAGVSGGGAATAGNSTFGSWCTAQGGQGDNGGTASGGDININGQNRMSSGGNFTATIDLHIGGAGGSTIYGRGGIGCMTAASGACTGNDGFGYGAGGGGGATADTNDYTGGSGTTGAVIITSIF